MGIVFTVVYLSVVLPMNLSRFGSWGPCHVRTVLKSELYKQVAQLLLLSNYLHMFIITAMSDNNIYQTMEELAAKFFTLSWLPFFATMYYNSRKCNGSFTSTYHCLKP